MSRDVRWCHTLNAHATHEYGPGIRFEHGGGRENRWRGTITDIRINSDGIPQYKCIPRERRERYDYEPRVRWVTIDQMEPYK